MIRDITSVLCVSALLAVSLTAQSAPLLQYTFDGAVGDGLTLNAGAFAPGAVPLVGHDEDGNPPNASAGALRGNGGLASEVSTGYPTWTLGASSWTVGFCLDTSSQSSGDPFMYVMGDPATQWRVFTSGSAGAGGIALAAAGSTGFRTTVARDGAGQAGWVHVVWVFDATASAGPECRSYVDGVLDLVIPQPNFLGLGRSGMSTLAVGRLPGSSPSLAAGADLEDFRLYNSAITDSEIAAWFEECIAGQWQTNSPRARLDINGATNDRFGPIVVDACVGERATLNADGLHGLQYEIALMFAPPVPADRPTRRFGDQKLNLDLFSSPTIFLNNFSFPGLTTRTWFYDVQAGVDLSAQMLVLDPTVPGGGRLSAAATVRSVAPGAPLAGPATEDGFIELDLAAPPLCLPGGVSFFGVPYSSLFVSANGRVSFGGADGDFSPTLGEAARGDPFIGVWADYSPQRGGGISIVGTAGGVEVRFRQIPFFGVGAGVADNDFRIAYESASGSWELGGLGGLSEDPGSNPTDQFVGLSHGFLSPGGMAFDPGPQSFIAGSGGSLSTPSAMLYEFGEAGTLLGGPPAALPIDAITFTPIGNDYVWTSR